jgi:hypothetical protein
MSVVPMITMVHHQSDLDAAGVTKGSTSLSSTGANATGAVASGANATGSAASTPNAAYKFGPMASAWDGFGALMGGSAVAMALGVAMIML